MKVVLLKDWTVEDAENGIIGDIMKIEINDGKVIVTMTMTEPTPSASGKTLSVASSKGNKVTTAMVDGKPVTIGLNAYIKR